MNPSIERQRPRPPFHRPAMRALLVLVSAAAAWLWAHEGHQPMPSRGATVDLAAGAITLSDDARRALREQKFPARIEDHRGHDFDARSPPGCGHRFLHA